MCGIAGLLSPSGGYGEEELGHLVNRMGDSLRHRGPDSAGVYIDRAAGFAVAHQRLAIIDTSPAGHQPMVSQCGRWALSYNGEIYNHAALRSELAAKGHIFRGQSDTEVLLNACASWGPTEACRRSIGMFAFALWDRELRQLTLARDRLGIKPLFLARAGSATLFASELKAFSRHPDFAAEVDRNALAAYLRRASFPAPHTVYEGVSKLSPGSVTTIAADGSTTSTRYWSFEDVVHSGLERREESAHDPDVVDETERLLSLAVRDRMIADVPLGAFLSGGIDSSLVVALMQQAASTPVRTYSIGSPNAGYDESRHARAVAAHLGTDHTEFIVGATEALEVVPKLADLLDEPFADSSIIPTHLVSQLARNHVTVVLSGDGGDEVFGGYTRHVIARSRMRRVLRLPLPARRLAAGLVLGVSPDAWDRAGQLIPEHRRPPRFGQQLHKAASNLAVADLDELYRRLSSVWQEPESAARGGVEPATWAVDESLPWLADPMERMLYRDTIGYLPDDALTKVDRATMAASLECRVPLIDHRVVEHAWTLPPHFKVRDGRSKWVLRTVLDRHVPRALIDRPKQGFGVPIGDWIRGPLRPWAEDLLTASRLRDDGYLDVGVVRSLWSQHLSGRRDHAHELWAVLIWQSWLERSSTS